MAQKRKLLESIASDEPNIWLQLHDGTRLPAHRELLALASSCAKGLPPGGDSWDLSRLQIDGGAPADKLLVGDWLEALYSCSLLEYGGAAVDDVVIFRNIDGSWYARLYLFADAVGSTSRVIDACLANIDTVLYFSVPASQQGVRVSLFLSGPPYTVDGGAATQELGPSSAGPARSRRRRTSSPRGSPCAPRPSRSSSRLCTWPRGRSSIGLWKS